MFERVARTKHINRPLRLLARIRRGVSVGLSRPGILGGMPEPSVTWWGHSMVSLRLGGLHMLTDPLLRGRVGPLRWYHQRPPDGLAGDVDVVLVSHLHRDHLDRLSLRRFPASTRIVVPRGAGRLVAGAVIEVGAGEELDLGGVTMRAVPASHGTDRDALPGGPHASPLGFVVGAERSVYFAGDTGLFDGLAAIGPVDLALLPVGGWGLTLGPEHLDPAGAARAAELVRARRALPIHWGSLRVPGVWRARPHLFLTPARRFADAARAPVLLPAPGEPVLL